MQKKGTKIEMWAREKAAEWKHIPSLKGKQAIRNLIILRIIGEKGHPISAWNIALEYLQRTNPKFNDWTADTIYHNRQKENVKVNRRLNFLKEKKYVKKQGSLYNWTSKAFFLMFILDCSIVPIHTDQSLWEDLEENSEKYYSFTAEATSKLTDEHKKMILKGLKDPAQAVAISAYWKKKLNSFKINLDEIEPKELFKLLFSKFPKPMKKIKI